MMRMTPPRTERSRPPEPRSGSEVDDYIQRADSWRAEMSELRTILLGAGLTEAIKWGKPCYDHQGRNIAVMQPMKKLLALMFFKGALLGDPHGILEAQGPNSRSALRISFTSGEDVTRLADILPTYVAGAIAVEDSGLAAPPAPALVLVEELRDRLDRDSALKAAFDALTPGRQREYNLHVASAKQAKTRRERVEKHVPRILAGKGLRDR